jgi:hypothetical protein
MSFRSGLWITLKNVNAPKKLYEPHDKVRELLTYLQMVASTLHPLRIGIDYQKDQQIVDYIARLLTELTIAHDNVRSPFSISEEYFEAVNIEPIKYEGKSRKDRGETFCSHHGFILITAHRLSCYVNRNQHKALWKYAQRFEESNRPCSDKVVHWEDVEYSSKQELVKNTISKLDKSLVETICSFDENLLHLEFIRAWKTFFKEKYDESFHYEESRLGTRVYSRWFERECFNGDGFITCKSDFDILLDLISKKVEIPSNNFLNGKVPQIVEERARRGRPSNTERNIEWAYRFLEGVRNGEWKEGPKHFFDGMSKLEPGYFKENGRDAVRIALRDAIIMLGDDTVKSILEKDLSSKGWIHRQLKRKQKTF